MKTRPPKALLWPTLASAGLGVLAYVYVSQVGIEVGTSADAFVLPAMAAHSSKLADGSVRTTVEITPAPWPSETRTIHRIVNLGMPVRVVVADGPRPIRFVVKRVAGGQLAGVFQSQADADALKLFVPGRL